MTAWELNFGLIPGILFGFREYKEEDKTDYVLYIGCIDICFTAFYEEIL